MVKKSTCVLVLGGHRSGTSMVAGVVRHLGVYMGTELIGETQYNPKGHWEDVHFVNLNKRVVGDWRRPVVDFSPVREAYAKLIDVRAKKHGLWGYKDPRMCFVFPHLQPVLTSRCNVKVITVRRDLKASAKSMKNRKSKKKGSTINVNINQAMRIARAYRDALNLSLQVYNGPLLEVRYEDFLNSKVQHIRRVSKFLGLSVSKAAITFVEPKLRHF